MALNIAILPCLFILFVLVLGDDKISSPFEFIKQLQGSQKGSKAQGLNDLKQYLTRFGYLNYHFTPNDINMEEHHFDEELEDALKRYQSFFRLNVTGILDRPTVSRMLMPRCGQPDITSHQHNTNSLHIVSRYAYFPAKSKWDKTNISYAFTLNYPAAYIPPVVRAFNTWASAFDYFTFYLVCDVENSDLKIAFVSGDHGDGHPFDGPRGTLAHAYAPTDGRFHYDADEKWFAGPGPLPDDDTFDLETVALHEIGHLLGLEHSQDENAIMWSMIGSGEVKGLHSDDIQGVRNLYGIGNDSENVSPAPSPISADRPENYELTF